VTAPARHTTGFAKESDIDAVAELLRAMDAYYGDPLPAPDDYASMVAATMASQEGTRFVLCFRDGEPAGLGCFAVLRPGSDLAGLIFVKDLFVRTELQGRGLGRELMRFIAEFAVTAGIGRIDLATDESNEGARKLYESLGGKLRPAAYYTFSQDVLRDLAKR
jgi:GNAT superfamily N-acetyltransferase